MKNLSEALTDGKTVIGHSGGYMKLNFGPVKEENGSDSISIRIGNKGRKYVIYQALGNEVVVVRTDDPLEYFKEHLREDLVNDVLKLKKGKMVTVGSDITVICLE